jgi:hypothetical protein
VGFDAQLTGSAIGDATILTHEVGDAADAKGDG